MQRIGIINKGFYIEELLTISDILKKIREIKKISSAKKLAEELGMQKIAKQNQ